MGDRIAAALHEDHPGAAIIVCYIADVGVARGIARRAIIVLQPIAVVMIQRIAWIMLLLTER
jgi:hypothetical protein